MGSRRIQVPISARCDVVTAYLHTFLSTRFRELDESFCATFAETGAFGFDCTGASNVWSDKYLQEPANTSSFEHIF
jgi:hypothetical protein